MSTFPFSLFGHTMILPVIYVRGRAALRVPKNNFGVNNANKQYALFFNIFNGLS